MEKCKFCQADLEEGAALCPACGKDNAEAVSAEQIPETTPVVEEIPETIPVVEEIPETTPVLEKEPEALTVQEIPQTQNGETPADEDGKTEETEKEEAEAAEQAEESGESEMEPSAEIKPGIQATPGKIALAAAAVVVLLAVLVALIIMGMKAKTPAEPTEAPEETVAYTVPADGTPGTITEKGTYTVTDEEAIANGDQVVATMNGQELTNEELQVYYWVEVRGFLSNYASYAPYFGLDYTKPLDTQISMDSPDMTWQHYFLQCALNNWQQIQGLKMEGEEAGVQISDEDQKFLAGIKETLEQNAAAYNMTLDEYMLNYVGPGELLEAFTKFQTDYIHGLTYYDAQVETFVPTQDDLDTYYAANEGEYTQTGLTRDTRLAAVRHILLTPESTAGDGTYSDADWEACRAAAQTLLDKWKAGEATEDSFAALVAENTDDPGSKETGGLYRDIYTGQMVEPFNDWCFDESRKAGDTDLVKTDYGYHIMYFVESYEGVHPLWKQAVTEDWINDKITAMFEEAMNKYPMEIDYSKISLGNVDLTK